MPFSPIVFVTIKNAEKNLSLLEKACFFSLYDLPLGTHYYEIRFDVDGFFFLIYIFDSFVYFKII